MPQREPRRFGILTAILWAAGLAVLTGMVGPVSFSGDDGLEERCRREVVELHQFFQDWFNGTLGRTDESYARFADVIDDDFVLISPEGRMTPRPPLIERLRGAHGAWKEGGDGKPGRIWIENFRLHRMAGDLAVVTYEEWQEVGGETRARLSTAVMGKRKGTPAGVVWLHLHEVWMPVEASDG